VDASPQRPLELILARNLLASLSTPAFLVNGPGDLLFYNEAAGALLGRRFEETGGMAAAEWIDLFGPLDENGDPIALDEQPITVALRANRPAHSRHRIRSVGGTEHSVEVSGLPVIGSGGFFWTTEGAA
jgi:PAS domain-containing protein